MCIQNNDKFLPDYSVMSYNICMNYARKEAYNDLPDHMMSGLA